MGRGRRWKWVPGFCLSPGVEHSCLPKRHCSKNPHSIQSHLAKHLTRDALPLKTLGILLIDLDIERVFLPSLISFINVFVSRGSI